MLASYLKLAIKVLLRRKIFTAISLLGICVTLTLLLLGAALVDHRLGAVGPEVRARRTLNIHSSARQFRDRVYGTGPGARVLERYFRRLPGAERTSFFFDAGALGYREGNRVAVRRRWTDADYWKILSFSFLEGGPFDEDDLRDARPVVVISESTRGKFFDRAPALGRTVELDGQRFTVVGVVPDASPLRPIAYADVWSPLTASRSKAYLELGAYLDGIVLASTTADLRLMNAELQARLSRWQSPDPGQYPRLDGSVRTGFQDFVSMVDHDLFGRTEWLNDSARLARLLLFTLSFSLLVMLVPAVNLVNLNVGRILERASEIGVRKAFGACSRSLVAQFVVENVVLTLVGAGLSVVVTAVVMAVASARRVLGATRLTIDLPVLAVAVGMALLFGLVSGVYPAWKMARLHPLAALRGVRR
jgi:putative ABC transport system permease protein